MVFIVSTVQEFEQAAERLSRADLIHLRAWLDDKIEDDLVVRDEVLDAIAQARSEVAAGKVAVRNSDKV
jgi:hypothetical protein